MHRDRYRILDVQRGPLTGVRRLVATEQERNTALSRTDAGAVVRRLARDSSAMLAELGAMVGQSAHGLGIAMSSARAAEEIARAIQSGDLLIVAGWDGRGLRERTAAPIVAATATSSPPPVAASVTREHELLFEYISNTGHPIVDDEGFELLAPDGSAEAGSLSLGRLHRRGVEPGAYELRVRAIRNAKWSAAEAHPFDEVRLVVQTKGYPDGTSVALEIRPALGAPDAEPVASLRATVRDGMAVQTWRYEQAVGAPCYEHLTFEAILNRKRAISDPLTIAPHEVGTTRGVQERLRNAGYDAGPPADSIDEAVGGAIMRFQEDHPPLEVTGELDELTLAMLDERVA